jgi:O-antigen/teichoic acid export membrane protein
VRQQFSLIIGWGAKIVAAGLALLNTRLFFHTLGTEGFAALSILLSLGPWLAIANLGLPGASQNELSRLRAEGADLTATLQTARSLSLTLAGATGVLILGLAPVVRHRVLADYQSASVGEVALICMGLLASGMGAIYSQILYALQRPLWPNVLPAVQAIATTALLGTLDFAGQKGLSAAAIAYALPVVALTVGSAWAIGGSWRWRVDRLVVARLFSTARSFLTFTIVSTATLSVDYLLMSQLLQAEDIAQYALLSRILTTLLGLHAVVLASAWPRLAEQHFKGDHYQMRKSVLATLGIGSLVSVIPAAAILAGHTLVFRALGAGHLHTPSLALLMLAFFYLTIRVWSDTFATVQLSTGRAGRLASFVVIQMLISVGGQLMLGSRFGAAGIFGGMSLSFILTVAWALPYQFYKSSRPRSTSSDHDGSEEPSQRRPGQLHEI